MACWILTFVFSTVCLILLATTSTAGMSVAGSKSIQAPVTNMVSYQDKLYVGGANHIYVLDEDLNILQKTSTCKESATVCKDNENINKILLIDKERQWLVACGTGNNGTCELRNLSNIEGIVSKSSATLERIYVTVSSDLHRPAVATITQRGELVIAVTFGNGIREERKDRYMTYANAISTRHLPDFVAFFSKELRLDIDQPSVGDYLIYYKASFQINWMTYFVTNQKSTVGAINYVSKLVRICQNDTRYSSYTDIVIQCTYDGDDYNIIQDAILLNMSRMIFVGAFSRGNNPENPSGGTAICVTELSSLDDGIMTAKKENALSCDIESNAERYLRSYKGSICIDERDYREKDFFCNRQLEAFTNVIGNTTFKMKSILKISNEDGIVTTMHGTTYLKNHIVLLLGTSSGKLLQTNLLGDFSIEEYGRETVYGSYPVKRVYVKDDNTLFVVTSHSVIKYSTYCSEYLTCAEIIAGKNPLCGWCVYKERATRSSDCSHGTNHWLSSLGKCVSLSVEPRGISVYTKHLNKNVTLNVKSLPVKEDSDTYSCKFLRGSQVFSTTTAIQISTATFSCELPELSAHTDAVIELLVMTKTGMTAVLSSTSFLFYDCGFYRSCVECVSTVGTKCDWCSETATCQETNACTIQSISLPTECPKLVDSRGKQYIPDRIRTLVVFQAENLINNENFIYKCILTRANIDVVADANATSISCPLNVMKTAGVRNQDYKISIAYGPEYGQLAELNDDFQNFVTVYDCKELASDCSHCMSLNRTRYHCEWCQNGQCIHRSSKCGTTKCPAPTITNVIPRDGPVQGGTRLTVLGKNLGKDISEVENISVAGVPCSLSVNREDYYASESQDFEAFPPSRLVCTTNASFGEITGIVIVTVDERSSKNSVQFAYKRSTITEIFPKFGPKSGGTRVTISGDNLGIGRRQVDVVIGNIKCLQTKVYPELPLDTKDENFNFTIQCTTPTSYAYENVTSLNLWVDGKFVGSYSVLYSYVADPVVTSISRTKGFVSGGTKVNIEGKRFDNAHVATLKIEQSKDSVDCEIMSPNQILCKAPRASPELAEEILRFSQLTMQQSTTCDGCLNIRAILRLDGLMRHFIMSYFRDPIIHSFSTDDKIITLDPNYPSLKIHGEYLNLVVTSIDVRITVGSQPCTIVNLTFSTIECYARITKPHSGMPDSRNPEVYVAIGNIHKRVGFVRYPEDDKSSTDTVPIVVSVVVTVVFLIVVALGVIVLYRKYRKVKEKVRYLERHKDESEMKEVERESRETIVNAAGKGEGAGIYADISEDEMIQAEGKYEKIGGYLEARPYLPINETALNTISADV